MANILKHRFASVKADGADATQVQPSHWNDGHLFTGGNAADVLIRDTQDASFGATWRALATMVGAWTDVPFSASNFTGSGSMVWTVTSGNQITYSYMVLGHTVFVLLTLTGTSVTVAVGTPFNVALPSGFIPNRASDTIAYASDNGISTIARVRIIATDPTIHLYRVDGANWAGSLSNTNISTQFMYQF